MRDSDRGAVHHGRPLMRIAVGGCLALGLVLAQGLALPPQAQAASAPPGQIAYVTATATGASSVWLMNADGSAQKLLTDQVGRVTGLAWSKDGSKLAMCSGTPSATSKPSDQLWILNTDGSGLRQVTVIPPSGKGTLAGTSIVSVAWSPDGSRLALVASWGDEDVMWGETSALFLLDLSSGRTKELGRSDGDEELGWQAVSWHPTGSKILVMRCAEESSWLDTVDVTTGAWIGAPDFSPDPAELSPDIMYPYTMDGAYSPDGSQIACAWTGCDFDNYANSTYFLMIGGLDGSNTRVVLKSADPTVEPSWSPDGQWLAAIGGKSADLHVILVPVSGGAQPTTLAEGSLCAWRPAIKESAEASSLQASCYGADYGTKSGDGTEDIDTTSTPRLAAQELSKAGLVAKAYLNQSASSAFARLPQDDVFYFDGHGNWDIISFEEPNDGTGSALITSDARNYTGIDTYVPFGTPDLSTMALAVLNSCDAGVDLDKQGNIMKAFSDAGCLCVIGFASTVTAGDGEKWSEGFFHYARADGLDVGTAALKAAEDTKGWGPFAWLDQGIDADMVVVKQREPMKLFIDQVPLGMTLPGLPNY